LKKQAPMLNLNCGELMETANDKRGTAFIELEEDEKDTAVFNKASSAKRKADSKGKNTRDDIKELRNSFLKKKPNNETQLPLKMKTFDDLTLNLTALKYSNKEDNKNEYSSFENLFNVNKPSNYKTFKEIPIVDKNKVNIFLNLGTRYGKSV
jgi:hypothetical protein